jgi:hypothetical protein
VSQPDSTAKDSIPKRTTHAHLRHLNQGELVGSNVEGIDIGCEAGVGLLGAVRADEGVDLDGVNVVELLEGALDLGLVGLDVDDEDEGVVLLHLLHGALGVEGVDDNLVLIEARLVRDGLAGVLGRAREHQGLGAVERGAVADLALLLGVTTLESSLSGGVGLLEALGGGYSREYASAIALLL